jgi:hypothetical protein
VVEKVTGDITVAGPGSPMEIARPKQQLEGPDPDPPTVGGQDAMDAYDRQLEQIADWRDDYRSADATLGFRGPALADCAARAGAIDGASATVKLTMRLDGVVTRATADKGGDAAVVACVSDVLLKRQTGAVLHGKDVVLPYTFRFHAAPAALPSAVDVELGVAGLPFGAESADMADARLSSSYRNTSHYYRGNDDDVQLMGVRVQLLFGFDADAGLYIVRAITSGDGASFELRERLKQRFGAPSWDPVLKCYYWRGERVIYVFETAPGSQDGKLSILDFVRAKEARLVDSLPGDSLAIDAAARTSMPRVLKEGAKEDAKAGAEAPDEPAP